MWWTVAALADDSAFCHAVRDRDVEVVRTLVLEGHSPSVFCTNADLGRSGGGSSRRRNTGDAVAIIASAGILAPFIAFGRRGGGGSSGEFSVDMAIRSGSADLLAALNAAGDVDRIQQCLAIELEHGNLAIARRCGKSLAKPTITELGSDMGTPARIALLKELDVTLGNERYPPSLDWGTSWARNPGSVQAALDLGLPPSALQSAATRALSWGPTEGLSALRTRHDVPLVVGEITIRWLESPRHRQRVMALKPDLSRATANWDFFAGDLIERPHALLGLLQMGLPASAFDGSIGPLLERGRPDLAAKMVELGAKRQVDFRIDELIDQPRTRAFIVEHGIQVEGIWTQHPWSDDAIETVLSDPELLEFTAAAGLTLCDVVEHAAETGRLSSLHGQRLTGCDADEITALGLDRSLLLAASEDGIPDRAANALGARAIDADRLDILELLEAHGSPPFHGYAMQESIRAAFDDGRTETAAAGLALYGRLDWLLRSHFDAVLTHLPDERFVMIELDKKSRQDMLVALFERERWSAAASILGPTREPREVFAAALQHEAPSEVILGLIDSGIEPRYPNNPLPYAIDRGDLELTRALLDRGARPSTADLENAYASGFPLGLLERLITPYTRKSSLRKIRKHMKKSGSPLEDVERLRRP